MTKTYTLRRKPNQDKTKQKSSPPFIFLPSKVQETRIHITNKGK